MGVIKRQGIKQSLVSYVGLVLGAINMLFIYPTALSTDELGMMRFLTDTARMIVPFAVLGLNQVALRFFPDFEEKEKGQNGLLFFLLMGTAIGVTIFVVLYAIFYQSIYDFYFPQFKEFTPYLWYMVLFVIGLSFTAIFNAMCMNYKHIAIPSIFTGLYFKIGQPLFALLYFWAIISYTNFLNGLILVVFFTTISLIIYLKHIGGLHWKPRFDFFDKGLMKEMRVYGFFGILTTLGSMLALRIDTFMLATFSANGLSDAGIYTIPNYIGNALAIPTTAIAMIATPLITLAWKENDLKTIKNLYTKSSMVLLVSGLLALIGIWASVEEIYAIIPNGEDYLPGMYAILIIGVAKVFDMATSVNQQIIGFSKYFRFNFYSLIILALINIVLNLFLIPEYGINGAAIATMISICLFNVLKFGYIWIKIGIQPFSVNTLKVLGIGGLVYVLATYLPLEGGPIFTAFLRSVFIVVLYCSLIYVFKVSADINQLPGQAWQRVKKLLGK